MLMLLAMAVVVSLCELTAQSAASRQPVASGASGASGAPTIGLLLGVADRITSEAPLDKPQRLTTYWIPVTQNGAQPAVAMSGLIVPHENGFMRIEVRHACERTDEGEDDCHDSVATSLLTTVPRIDANASSDYEPPPDGEDPTPCSYAARFVTFASPSLLSVRVYRGQSERCEPRGWHWIHQAGVVRLQHGTYATLPFSGLVGPSGKRAYARAAAKAFAEWKVEFPGESYGTCVPDPKNDWHWYIARKELRWVPMLQQQPGSGFCDMEASIHVTLPPAALGFREPIVPIETIKARVPKAQQAHISPDGSLWLVVAAGDVILMRASGGPPLLTMRPGEVVMVQWALPPHVSRWHQRFTS